MNNEHSIIKNTTLKTRIKALPNDSVLFPSDFPEYHSEFVGSTLSELTNSGVLSPDILKRQRLLQNML